MLKPCFDQALIIALLKKWHPHFFLRARISIAGVSVLAMASLVLLLSSARAQAQASSIEGRQIVSLRIEGAQTVAEGEILGRLFSRVGNSLQTELLTQDIKNIHSLGLFSEIQVLTVQEGSGVRLIFRVVERLRIAELEVTGSRLLSKKDKEKAILLRVGDVLLRSQLQDSIEALQQEYRKKGYFKTRISSRQERLVGGQLRVSLLVEEDPRVYLTRIRTQGNKVFSQLQVRRWMRSAEVDCFSWANHSGLFQEEIINHDLQSISLEYLQRGYLRVLIRRPEIKLVRRRGYYTVHVDISIVEGEQYTTRSVDVQGDILGDKSRLLDSLAIQSGEIFNLLGNNQDVFRLRDFYQEQGYAFARVIPDVKINDVDRTVDVVYQVIQGERAYIGRIEVQGNVTTHDDVIRREFSITENTLYNGKKLRESQAQISRLGYFEPSLSVDTEASDVDNILDVRTRVAEGRTGSFQFQLSYGKITGLQTLISLAKANFRGRGQTLRLDLRGTQQGVERETRLSFTEPYLFGIPLSGTTSIFVNRQEDFSELERGLLDEEGISQSFSRRIIGPLRSNFTLGIKNKEFELEPDDNQQLVSLTLGLSWNTVNHPIFPSRGTSLGGFFTNVVGSTKFRRYTLNGRRFFGFGSDAKVVLMTRARFGWLQKITQNDIPPEERYRLGGVATLRGYSHLEIGGVYGRRQRKINGSTTLRTDLQGNPLADVSGNPISGLQDRRTLGLTQEELDKLIGGGIHRRLFNIELLMPLAGPVFRSVIFYDAGQVNSEPQQYSILNTPEPDFFDLRQAYGAGMRIITPLGVLRFEYGVKISPHKNENPDEFDFTISSLF